jgi:RNA-binding protein
MTLEMEAYQRKYLRGLAHHLKPIVLIGQRGITAAVLASLDAALSHHELVKIKFIENKETAFKQQAVNVIQAQTGAHLAGLIGHTAIFYRPHPQVANRKIILPGPSSHSVSHH